MTQLCCQQCPTAEENKMMQKLFLAIYFNDLDEVIRFKQAYPEIYAKKDHFILENDEEKNILDLRQLTAFNSVIWLDETWKDDDFIKKNKQNTKAMVDFWQSEQESPSESKQAMYHSYWYYFYAEDPDDYQVVPISETVDFYVQEGFRRLDMQLFNRATCFDFAATRSLLEQGARWDIHLDEHDNLGGRIYMEGVFLRTSYIFPYFENFHKKGYGIALDDDLDDVMTMFIHLLALSAHTEMDHLLDEFDGNCEDE
jgi:hypothetical protein